MIHDNNQPLSLFCFMLNKFIKYQRDYSLRLSDIQNLKKYNCELITEIDDHLLPGFLFKIELQNLEDEYEINKMASKIATFNFDLNHRTGNFEIEVDKDKFTVRIDNLITDVFLIIGKAEKLFEQRVEAIMNYAENWMSERAHAEMVRERGIERQIHERQLFVEQY
jgi:hypothetical protein